jgi:hypothetical protein
MCKFSFNNSSFLPSLNYNVIGVYYQQRGLVILKWFKSLIPAFLIPPLLFGCGSIQTASQQETDYNKGIQLIKEKKWSEAKQAFDKLTDYKDANVLDIYAQANIRSKTDSDILFYNQAASLLSSIHDDYQGELHEEVLNFKKEAADKAAPSNKTNTTKDPNDLSSLSDEELLKKADEQIKRNEQIINNSQPVLKVTIDKFNSDGYGYVDVEGSIKNNDTKPHSFIKLEAKYQDKNNNVIDKDYTYAIGGENLLPGESKSFHFMSRDHSGVANVHVSVIDAR